MQLVVGINKGDHCHLKKEDILKEGEYDFHIINMIRCSIEQSCLGWGVVDLWRNKWAKKRKKSKNGGKFRDVKSDEFGISIKVLREYR